MYTGSNPVPVTLPAKLIRMSVCFVNRRQRVRFSAAGSKPVWSLLTTEQADCFITPRRIIKAYNSSVHILNRFTLVTHLRIVPDTLR